MQAHDIMKEQVITANETDTLRSVIEKFINQGISGLPIINDKNKIVAYISDGDIMRYIGKREDVIIDTLYFVNVIKVNDGGFEEKVGKILNLTIKDISQKKVEKVSWDEEIESVASILGNKHIKKLPVERNGELVGIISRGDVIRESFKELL
ncbi:CBS domain-containing protein [Salibacterium salarium]|uniref:CBS domain-containing protein n=1 Tax=Salibacterium salarium TaxID=284579 RepID=A0A428N0E1_9BACI|nr:CBS domain-containing protein [Salibacterium salarium]RSL31904.1 CBS domain-containing protein [Salibacterium salarium]